MGEGMREVGVGWRKTNRKGEKRNRERETLQEKKEEGMREEGGDKNGK